MPALSFCLLGRVDARVDGVPVDLGTRKQRALLALLLLDAGRVVSADRIVDELWGGQPPARASASLQAYVSNLRRALEPERAPGAPPTVLVTEPPGYRLAVEQAQVDVGRFEEGAAASAAALTAGDPGSALTSADEALACWRGEALAEFAGEAWAEAEVARLAELRLAVQEDRLRALVELGQLVPAIVELERLVEEHPLRERLCGLLMLALYRAGRTADALAAYQRVRRVLGEELGLEPGPELRELESAILRQDEVLQPGPRAAAPPGRSRVAPAPAGAPAASVLVGRDADLARLGGVVAGLDHPDPPWVLLEGEAGIGKTRLAEELAAQASAAGAVVAWGRAHEDRDAPGFWPWLQVLDRLDPGAAADLTAAEDLGDRFARYQRVAERLVAAAADRPLLVLLDDLHWADADSLRLLAFLAVQVHGARLSVVATCRDGEPRPELAEALATLTRRDGLLRHGLGPLDATDVAPLAGSVGAAPVTEVEAAELHERTAGNPFLLSELLRLPAAARAASLPGGVRDVVRRRLSSLPEESQAVLTLAAVIGKEFDLGLLARAAGVDLDRIVDLVDAALARRIVVRGDSTGRFRFAHDLLREVLLAELGDLRRRRLHARVADALEALPGARERRITELARHRVEAAPLVGVDVAVAIAVEAAHRAESQLAFDEAVGWYAAAVDLLDPEPHLDPDGEQRQRLLLAEARALALAGRVLPWRAVLARTLRLAVERDDLEAFVDGVGVLVGGGASWLWSLSYEDPTEVLALLDEVLGRLDDDQLAFRSRVTAAVAQGVYYRDGVDRAAELAHEALDLARRDGDARVVADALMSAAQCLWGADRVDEQYAVTDELLGMGEACTVEHELACRAIRTTVLLGRGDLAAADAEHAAFLDLADRHQRRGILAQLAWYPATRATIVGDLDVCDALMDEARRVQQSLEVYLADLIDAGARAIRCYAVDDLDALPAELVATLTAYAFGGGAVYPALIAARHGRLEEARAGLAGLLDVPHRFHDWLWLSDMVIWADLAASVGDPGPVAGGLAALRPFARRFAVAGTAVGATGPVAYAIGRLELAAGDERAAASSFREGLALAESMGARTWVDRGRSLLTRCSSTS